MEAAIRLEAEKAGMKAKDVFMELRVAVTGKNRRPSAFGIAGNFGKRRNSHETFAINSGSVVSDSLREWGMWVGNV